MAQANEIYLRRAVVAAMVADAGVLASVPASSIYGPQRPVSPARPWAGFDHVASTEFAASCIAGTDHDFRVQLAFATSETASGEELSLTAAGAVKALLDGAGLDLAAYGSPAPAKAYLDWVSTLPLQGDSPDDWRAIVSFRARVAS